MELLQARAIAEEILELLRPYCDRLEIAGSIRREKPYVKDIEIVCIPKRIEQTQGSLFGADEVTVSPIEGFIVAVNQWEKVKGEPSGKYTQRIIPAGRGESINLDLFMVTAENWGLQLAIRTGPFEYSHKVLAGSWVRKGYNAEGGILYKKKDPGSPIHIREERDLYNMFGIPWKEPKDRFNP